MPGLGGTVVRRAAPGSHSGTQAAKGQLSSTPAFLGCSGYWHPTGRWGKRERIVAGRYLWGEARGGMHAFCSPFPVKSKSHGEV